MENFFSFHYIVNLLYLLDNLLLFMFFSILSLFSIYLKNQFFLKMFFKTREFEHEKSKLVLEIIFYLVLANYFLFSKNEEIILISLLTIVQNIFFQYLSQSLMIFSNLQYGIQEILYALQHIGAFCAFIILINGFFLIFHKKELESVYPHLQLKKESLFKKQLTLGFSLTILFGFYPLTFLM